MAEGPLGHMSALALAYSPESNVLEPLGYDPLADIVVL
jgi:hypothetical protein